MRPVSAAPPLSISSILNPEAAKVLCHVVRALLCPGRPDVAPFRENLLFSKAAKTRYFEVDAQVLKGEARGASGRNPIPGRPV